MLNNDKIKGGKKSIIIIPIDIHKPAGSSYETVLGPVGCLTASKTAITATIKDKKKHKESFKHNKELLWCFYTVCNMV
ncbi:hypothetical protein [Lentibacillus daqui]|uniref:hypothetical protein n=1 Tax=Lentibacillus daqui TaxID=2911514 RepID=UPI003F71688A